MSLGTRTNVGRISTYSKFKQINRHAPPICNADLVIPSDSNHYPAMDRILAGATKVGRLHRSVSGKHVCIPTRFRVRLEERRRDIATRDNVGIKSCPTT